VKYKANKPKSFPPHAPREEHTSALLSAYVLLRVTRTKISGPGNTRYHRVVSTSPLQMAHQPFTHPNKDKANENTQDTYDLFPFFFSFNVLVLLGVDFDFFL
jgi:hypothetical protein